MKISEVVKKVGDSTIEFNGRLFTVGKDACIWAMPYKNTYGRKIKATKLKKNRLKNGYLAVSLNANGKAYSPTVHRLLAFVYFDDFEEGKDVHHIDGVRTNNDLENLRVVTRSENLRSKMVPMGLSKHRGVCFDKQTGKWRAKIKDRGRTISIGRYKKEQEAAQAYNKKATELGFDVTALNEIS